MRYITNKNYDNGIILLLLLLYLYYITNKINDMKKTFWIIAVHPINGVAVEKLEFSDKDEMYLDDVQGWDDFNDYAEYYVDDRIDYYERKLYTAVAVENEERLSIIKKLKSQN